MHLDPADPDHAMEHTPTLQHMVGYIKMVAAQDRKSRQKRVAMMAVQVICIAPISRLEHRSKLRTMGQKNLLTLARPVFNVAGVTIVTTLNFLQKNQVGLELMQASPQLIQGRSPPKSKQLSRHALVNVVGGDSQRG